MFILYKNYKISMDIPDLMSKATWWYEYVHEEFLFYFLFFNAMQLVEIDYTWS